MVGRVEMSPTALRIETNSRARADALRERIEGACGSHIRHRAREHSDPFALAAASGNVPQPPAPPSPEEERLVAELKARHYADWADQPLPALDNRTPRECARTAAGRAEVDLLLTDMEHREGVGAQPFGCDEAAVGSLATVTAAGARSRHEIKGPSEVQDEVSRGELVSVRAGLGPARGRDAVALCRRHGRVAPVAVRSTRRAEDVLGLCDRDALVHNSIEG